MLIFLESYLSEHEELTEPGGQSQEDPEVAEHTVERLLHGLLPELAGDESLPEGEGAVVDSRMGV